jgi:hypothetical protein
MSDGNFRHLEDHVPRVADLAEGTSQTIRRKASYLSGGNSSGW